MFRRRKREEQPDADPQADAAGAAEPGATEPGATDRGAADPAAAAGPVQPERPQGPWDAADVPAAEVHRIDLGGLQVPVPPATEVRVDVSPEGEVVAATMVQGQAQMQVNAFAAPRTEGIWPEVREEIRAALVEGGGQAAERPGPFGTELHALVPTEVPGQGKAFAPARFVGIDGPRWFLRALFTGAAAVERGAAAPLEAALRDVVVVRGGDPMAVRDPLPLRLPKEVAEQAAAQGGQQPGTGAGTDDPGADAGSQPPDRPALAMPERGPEITETR